MAPKKGPLRPGDYAVILDSIAEGVFTVDPQWRITSFNRAAEKITGFSREEALGQYCYEIFRSDRCFDRCPLRETMETGKTLVEQEVRILDRHNREIPVSVSTALLRDEQGKIIGGVETFRDLSALKELEEEVKEKYTFRDIVSRNPRMLEIFRVLPEVAASDATVLIQGESGTGKELFARAIHDLSPRRERPLVKVNCAAVPETLLESELFGYVKGAFTDAKRDKPGRFKLAEGGTVFLDEIGDMPLALQAKLLRVLESKEYEPLGATRTERADVRIVAATNRDLEGMVKEGQFREDLYYRLNVFKIELPPLRQRREDIPLLVEHFITKLRHKTGKEIEGVTEEAMGFILEHSWPGNVRELENVLEHAFILCKDRWIRPEHLPEYLRKRPTLTYGGSLRQMERELIERTLKDCRGNISRAARQLGIHRTTLWRKLKKYGLL